MYVRSLRTVAIAASLISVASCGDVTAGRSESDAGVIPSNGKDGGRGDSGLVDGEVPDPNTTDECGNGVRIYPEACDDHNTVGGDGCSADCTVLEPAYECPVAGMPCIDKSVCNDKMVSGHEQCDDGNTTAGDGCGTTCQIEPGYACRVPGAKCRAASCGDGIVAGLEDCDDQNSSTPGCDNLCRVEAGYACPPGASCRATVCGDGNVEGSEECEDNNTTPYDGCFNCQREPSCANAACTAVCGDGIKFPGEACDDGNKRSDDGCSKDCQTEAGFVCQQIVAEAPTMLDIPVIYRDLRGFDLAAIPAKSIAAGHPDFENKNVTETGIVKDTLGADKKPQYSKATGGTSSTTSKAMFDKWYNDDAAYNRTVVDKLTFARQSDSSYQFFDSTFFPLDTRGFIAEGAESVRNDGHNFHFTSEVRYWFEYKGGEKLDFSGDDDVWVFVNGKLAIDLGGVHGVSNGSVTLDVDGDDTRFGITSGKIYEMVVFQAERHTTASQYKLTLRGFDKARTSCVSKCGDGIVTEDEICDDAKNDGTYGSCMPGCQGFGPNCGDGVLQKDNGETCDDGNKDVTDGCDNACNYTRTIFF